MKVLFVMSAFLFSVSAFAGDVIYGTGDTRQEACNEANYQASRIATQRNRSYNRCSFDSCVKVSNYYRCYAVVNHWSASAGQIDVEDYSVESVDSMEY